MKAGEMIALLQAEIEKKGDAEVYLHGAYGAAETTFEPLSSEYFYKDKSRWFWPEDNPNFIHFWTNICTG